MLLTGPLHATLHLFAAVHTLAIGAELIDQRRAATAVHAVPAAWPTCSDELPTDAPAAHRGGGRQRTARGPCRAGERPRRSR